MFIKDKLKERKTFSMEVFPPKREGGYEKLLDVVKKLKYLEPDFISVTYGAGGSTQSLTKEIATDINNLGIDSMAHLTCVGSSKDEMKALLKQLKEANIENILALRGDPPKGQEKFVATKNGFSTAAELVQFIKKEEDSFSIGVAGYPEKHPEAPSLDKDIEYLKMKVDQGADFIITQLFFNNEYYYRYYEKIRKASISTPVLPGIFLFSSYKQLTKTVELSSAEIPSKLEKKLYQYRNNAEDVKKFGMEYAINQSIDILKRGMAEGLHFYIMNRNDVIEEVFKELSSYIKV